MGALESLGLRDVFDVVYGSSGGAPNGAYFVAGQAVYGMSIYLDHISGQQFISLRHLLRGRALIDLTYGFEEVIGRRVALDWTSVLQSPIPLKIIATSIDKASPVVLDELRSKADLLTALHASARVPMLGGAPLRFRGERLWDANLTDPFAINTAVRDRCTHVLVLRSRPRGGPRRTLNLFERVVLHPYIQRLNPVLAELFLRRFDPDVTGEDRIGRNEHGVAISQIAPLADAPQIRRLEQNRHRLVAGARSGVEAVFSYLGLATPLVLESLTIFDTQGRRIFPGRIGPPQMID